MRTIAPIVCVAIALVLGACQSTDTQPQDETDKASATAAPSSAPRTRVLVPDYEQAEEIATYLRKHRTWGYPEELIARGDAIVPGLVALVQRGDGQVSDALNLRLWQYAGFMLGQIGDKRVVPYMLERLDDDGAMDFYFVDALGRLQVDQAVPVLVDELRTMDENGWNVMTSAYRTRATYLIHALELITDQSFPKNQHGDPTSKEETLKAVMSWWMADGMNRYLVIAVNDPRLSPYREELAKLKISSTPAEIEAIFGQSDNVPRARSSASESVHTLDNGGQLRIMSLPKESATRWETAARYMPKSQPGQAWSVTSEGLRLNLAGGMSKGNR